MSNKEIEAPKHYTFKASGELKLAEHVRAVHHLWVPVGVSLEQAIDVKSFVHIADKLQANSEIILRAEDDSFYARVLIRLVKNHDVVVTVLEKFSLGKNTAPLKDNEYEVSFINNRYQWGFKRKGSSDWIIKEIATEEAALSALNDHRKALAA
jgi:hypothetical protein